MNWKHGALLLAVVVSLSCTAAQNGEPSGDQPAHNLTGTHWELVSLRDSAAAAGRRASLRLDAAESRFTGSSGCNSYGGQYLLNGDSLTFRETFATKMACVDPAMMTQEAGYFEVLSEVRAWRIAGPTLELLSPIGVVARLEASDSL